MLAPAICLLWPKRQLLAAVKTQKAGSNFGGWDGPCDTPPMSSSSDNGDLTSESVNARNVVSAVPRPASGHIISERVIERKSGSPEAKKRFITSYSSSFVQEEQAS